MKLDVRRAENHGTLELVDRIERRQVTLRFPSAVSPVPADVATFIHPVDRAVGVTTERLTVEPSDLVSVLDDTGTFRTYVGTESGPTELPPGSYYLNVANQLKTYLRVEAEAPFEVEVLLDGAAPAVHVDFGTETAVEIGVRSLHERPEATITTTRDPRDVMRAVSAFGSALKETGPDRSFPSLRGHPPDLEVGEELCVPSELTRPETGVTIEVPPTYEYVFPLAPLAYYLGAEVVPGERPVIRTANGFEYELEGRAGFETTVERVLKHVFTCDSYVRAAGPLAFEMDRHAAFVCDTGLDAEAVYDRPLAEQLEAYLGVPFEAVDPYVPEWGVGAHLEAIPEHVGFLPFLANDLAVVHAPSVQWSAPRNSVADAAPAAGLPEGEFLRGSSATPAIRAGSGLVGPSTPPGLPDPPAAPDSPPSVPAVGPSPGPHRSWPGEAAPAVAPAALDTQEQLWIADGIPLGADKPDLHAYRRALDRDPVEEVEVLVVCNDARMAEEDEVVRDLLGSGSAFGVTIRAYRDLPTDQLRALLERGADVLHYIGHIDDEGFACPDGTLDARTLESVDVDVCFLNACRSVAQGRALVDAGAIAGIVTLDDVRNSVAVRVGRTLASLLRGGFPLNTALRIAGDEHGGDERYTVIGDGRVQVAQSENHIQLVHVDRVAAETSDVRIQTFVTPQSPLGSAFTPTLDAIDEVDLVGETIGGSVSNEGFIEFLGTEPLPVRLDGRLDWSVEVGRRLTTVTDYSQKLDEVTRLLNRSLTGGPAGSGGGSPAHGADVRLRERAQQLDDCYRQLDLADFRLLYQVAFDDSAGAAGG